MTEKNINRGGDEQRNTRKPFIKNGLRLSPQSCFKWKAEKNNNF
jgi:hypothetical protein